MVRSRSSVAARMAGHANFLSTRKTAMKTSHVQTKSPMFTSNGELGPSAPPSAAASTASQAAYMGTP